MSLDDEFAELVGELTVSMVIVTTGSAPDAAGCLVGFHSQCGIDPPAYVVWVSKANRTYRSGASNEYFAVHLAERAARDVVRLFGEATGDAVDKFASCEWISGPHDVPLLDACPNRFVGRRIGLLDIGVDHVGVVLEPIAVDHPRSADPVSLTEVIDLDAGHDADDDG